MKNRKLLILGGGPAGYTAAFLAADSGINVTLIDIGPSLGGVCLHRGCIPSKALLHIAKLINDAQMAETFGIKFSKPEIQLNIIREWKNRIVSKMSSGLEVLAKKRGVDFFKGYGRFKDSQTIVVNGDKEVKFDQAIIAVGSSPTIPAPFIKNSPLIMDSTAALEIEEIPERLLIVGGGYIGLEMGTFFSALGSHITLVEMAENLLSEVDRDLVRILQRRLEKKFENIFTNTKLISLDVSNHQVNVRLEGNIKSSQQTFDRLLVCVGRIPNSDNLGLENTRVEKDGHGFIQVNSRQRTNDPSIFAIGDVVGGAMLAHKAVREAKVAVENILEGSIEFNNKAIPAVVFTDPEIAWCGITETEAKSQKIDIEVASFPWAASGRAASLDRKDGLTKLIIEPQTGRILGVGMVGTGVGELIAEGVFAIEMNAVVEDIAKTIHPHPTLSETLMEAAEVHLNRAIHLYKIR